MKFEVKISGDIGEELKDCNKLYVCINIKQNI